VIAGTSETIRIGSESVVLAASGRCTWRSSAQALRVVNTAKATTSRTGDRLLLGNADMVAE
jgi:hypothetical protein